MSAAPPEMKKKEVQQEEKEWTMAAPLSPIHLRSVQSATPRVLDAGILCVENQKSPEEQPPWPHAPASDTQPLLSEDEGILAGGKNGFSRDGCTNQHLRPN
ncbi:unnamed protein product [Lampetra planeri]